MIHNPVIDTMMQRKSIRKYTLQQPDADVAETIVRAGQQAPFALPAGQRNVCHGDREHNPFSAPLFVHHLHGYASL